MYKKSLFFALVLCFPAVAFAQIATLNGNMDGTITRGTSMTFQIDIVIGSQGYTGYLSLVMHGDPGIGFPSGSAQPAVLTCNGDKSGASCSGNVMLSPGAVVRVSQPVRVFTDAYSSQQKWTAELHGDFVSGVPVKVGQITVPDKRARIVMERAPDVMLHAPGGDASTTMILKNAGDAAGDYRVSAVSGSPVLVSFAPASGTLQPGEEIVVLLIAFNNLPGGDNAGALQVDRTLDDPILVRIRVVVANRPAGNPVAQVPLRINSDGLADVAFVVSNSGNDVLTGAFSSDALWVIPPSGIVSIPAGQSNAFTASVDQTQFPAPGDAGSTSASLKLIFFNGGSGKGLRPLDSPGTTTVSIGFVATVPPTVSNSSIPPLAHRCQSIGCWDETAIFVPGVGHAAGSVGLFISDVTLYPQTGFGTNGQLRSLENVDMYFTPLGAASSTARKTTIASLAPPASATFGDMVSSVYGNSQVGTLQVRAPGFVIDSTVGLNANVFNVSNKAGTYGTSLPIFLSYASATGMEKLFLTGLKKDATSHTNIYLQESLGSDITANIDFYNTQGSKIGSTSASVPAFAAIQLGGNTVPAGTVSAILSVGTGSGGLHAYATPVDEASGDTWVVADWSRIYSYYESFLPPTGVNVLVPVAGAAHGANNTYFKTDAAIMNVGSVASSGTLRYYNRSGQIIDKTVTLNVLETKILEDITTNFFGVTTDSVGYITYKPTTGRVAITSRNYTTSPGSAATFGTAVPTLPMATTFPSGGSTGGSGLRSGTTIRIGGIEDAALSTVGAQQPGSFRSNFGLVETKGQPATVRVTIYYNTNTDKTAVVQGASKTFDLAANQFMLIGSIANAVLGAGRASLGDLHNLTVEFTLTSTTGQVVPFISSVDNGSGDSTFRVN
jgi:hypothetical protein